jgi:hypothetical protein
VIESCFIVIIIIVIIITIIIIFILIITYVCETVSLTQREEYRMRAFMRIFVPKRGEHHEIGRG